MKGKTIIYRCLLVLFDVFTVNFAYWFVLVLRFYDNYSLGMNLTSFAAVWRRIAPMYTVAALVIFALFRLYHTRWSIAGLHDMNHIIMADVAAGVFYIVSSLLTGNRMPISVYALGPVVQFLMLMASRFCAKFILMEKKLLAQRRAGTNVMVIGVKYLGQSVRTQFEDNNTLKIACMVDTENTESNTEFKGIPVIPVDAVEAALKKYSISHVIIADTFLSDDARKHISHLCEEREIELRDYTGFIQNDGGYISLVGLLQKTTGPVTLRIHHKNQTFENGEQALLSINRKYYVRTITGADMVIHLSEHPTGTKEDEENNWVQDFEEKTGEEVSFF